MSSLKNDTLNILRSHLVRLQEEHHVGGGHFTDHQPVTDSMKHVKDHFSQFIATLHYAILTTLPVRCLWNGLPMTSHHKQAQEPQKPQSSFLFRAKGEQS